MKIDFRIKFIIVFILFANSLFSQNDTIYDSYYKKLKAELLSDPNIIKVKLVKKIYKHKQYKYLIKAMLAKYKNEKGFWKVGIEIGYDLNENYIASKSYIDITTRTLFDTSYSYFKDGTVANRTIYDNSSKPISTKMGFSLFSALFGNYYMKMPSSYRIIEKYCNGNDSIDKPYRYFENKWFELDGEAKLYKPDGTVDRFVYYKKGIEVSKNLIDESTVNTEEINACAELSLIYSNLFIRYIKENKNDSANVIIERWEAFCGFNEPNQRAKILLNLKNKTFTNDCINDSIIFKIINYQNRLDSKQKDKFELLTDKSVITVNKKNNPFFYDSLKSIFNYIPIGDEFDKFTSELAEKIKTTYTEGSIENLLCSFYGNDQSFFYRNIQNLKNNNSKLYQKYIEVATEYTDMHFSTISGLWIPTGSMKAFGYHPELGIRVGGKYKKYNVDFNIAIRFGETKEPYFALRPDSTNPESTRSFQGTFIGATCGYDLLQFRHFSLSLLGGISGEGFEALKGDTIIKKATVSTYNFSLGSEVRIYFARNFYLGVQGQYNIVNYKLSHVLNYTSNPFTLRFMIGFLGNFYKKALRYKLYY